MKWSKKSLEYLFPRLDDEGLALSTGDFLTQEVSSPSKEKEKMSSRRKKVKGLAKRLRDIVYRMEGGGVVPPAGDIVGFVVYERVHNNENMFVSPLANIKIFRQPSEAKEFIDYRRNITTTLKEGDHLIVTIYYGEKGSISIPKVMDEKDMRSMGNG